MYNHAHGLYADTWSAWSELAINVTITVIAGYLWGIIGILLGKIISTSVIIVLWKPYYLFRNGLHHSYKEYWRGASHNYLASAICFIIGHQMLHLLPINPYVNFGYWVVYCTTGTVLFSIICIPTVFFFCWGGKDCVQRITNLLLRKK